MKDITIQPPFISPAMAALRVQCGCGEVLRPDFWRLHDEPFTPIESECDPNGRWRQVSVGLPCVCGRTHQIPVPAKDLTVQAHFYGDEAYRDVGASKLAVYSILGGSSGPVTDASNALQDAKRRILPDRDPSEWTVHATKMASGQQRLKSNWYRNMRRDQVERFFDDCQQVIYALGEWGWNISAVSGYLLARHSKGDQKRVWRSIETGLYLGLLGYAIHLTTGSGLRPIFTFDAQTVAGAEARKEGWAERAFLGSQRYLGHLFISHSNLVPPPISVSPGSHPILELADVHAFFLARAMERRLRGMEPDRPITAFGKFTYLGFRGDRLEVTKGDDVPESFYF